MRRRARVGVAARRPPRAHSRCVRCRMNTRMAGAGGVNRTRQTATQHPWRKMAHGIAQLREVEMPDTRYCYQVVAASVDTLEVNGLNRMAEHITEQMTALQQAAIAERDTHRTRGKTCVETPWKLAGQTLFIAPHGARKGQFQFHLICPAAAIEAGDGHFNDITIHVRLSSAFLHEHGYRTAWDHVETLLRQWGTFQYQPGEVHLYADVAGMLTDTLRRRDFVTRAQFTRWHVEDATIIELVERHKRPERDDASIQVIQRHGQQETLEFGRKTSPHACSVYDKPREIRLHSPDKLWFADIWRRHGWDEKSPITRVEMRYKRAILHEMGIETMEALFDRLDALWAYSTQEWMRHTTPNGAQDTKRWPASRFWQVVQATRFEHDEMDPAQRDKVRVFHEARILSTILGYIESWSAWHAGNDDVPDTLDLSSSLRDIANRADDHYLQHETDFLAEVQAKRKRLAVAKQQKGETKDTSDASDIGA